MSRRIDSQGDPLWGSHSNGRSRCPACNDARLKRQAEQAEEPR